jgi:hypothetical protein
MFKGFLTPLRMLALIVVAALAACSQANAQNAIGHAARGAPEVHFDGRFSHNQYYHDRGYAVRGIPRGAYSIHHGGNAFYYHGGEWYRPHGQYSVVIGPPIGAFVPTLPPFYSTVWWGGVPYYYANDAYYSWNPGANEYEVVSPPAEIETDGTTATPSADSIFVYPKSGQSTEQQSKDRYECYSSAVSGTGYDPTVSGGGVSPDIAASKRADYMRADSACLDARGYSVK